MMSYPVFQLLSTVDHLYASDIAYHSITLDSVLPYSSANKFCRLRDETFYTALIQFGCKQPI